MNGRTPSARSRAPRALLGLVLAAALGGCAPDGAPAIPADAQPRLDRPAATGWTGRPTGGFELRGTADSLVVATGPHAVLWPEELPPLQPPYTVRATLQKEAGRIHEAFGIVIGGDPLDAPEDAQAYSYFLVRGDGSFLVRRREGTELPILRPWTTHRSIRRDGDEGGQPNELAVEVGREETVFRVNGAEVTRLGSAELRTAGRVGIRVSHDVTLAIRSFRAVPGTP